MDNFKFEYEFQMSNMLTSFDLAKKIKCFLTGFNKLSFVSQAS